MLAPAQLCDDEVEQISPSDEARAGQRQYVMAQPRSERSDVAGKRMRLCLGLTDELDPIVNVWNTLAKLAVKNQRN